MCGDSGKNEDGVDIPELPAPWDRIKRREKILIDAGNRVSDVVSQHIKAVHGIANAVKFIGGIALPGLRRGETQAWDSVIDYFCAVGEFKNKHGFDPDKLVNASKRTALMTRIMVYQNPARFFRVDGKIKGSDWERILVPMYIFFIIYSFLYLDSDKVVGRMFSDDLLLCLCQTAAGERSLPGDEWLSWAFHAFQKASAVDGEMASSPMGNGGADR